VIIRLEEGRRDLEAMISEGDVRLSDIEQAKAGTAAERGALYSSNVVVMDVWFRRCNPLSGAPGIRPESKRVHLHAA
jgi:hypothetical protein